VNARVVRAARGLRWILEGFRLFLAAPVGWLVLAFAYLAGSMLLSSLPVIGFPLYLLLYPAVLVVFMIASRASALRQPLEARMLLAGVRERIRPLLVLGGAYAIGVVLAIFGSALADDGALLRVLGRAQGEADAAGGSAAARDGLMAVLLLYVPTFMMTFFSPLLVAWHDMPPLKALFYSFFACLLNWRAFLAYVLAGSLLAFIATNLIFALALALAGPEMRANPAQLLPVIAPSLILMAMPVIMTSTYASYRDVFAAPEAT